MTVLPAFTALGGHFPPIHHGEIAALIAPIHAESWRATYRGIFTDSYLDGEVAKERLSHWQARVPELSHGTGEIFLATIGGVSAGFMH